MTLEAALRERFGALRRLTPIPGGDAHRAVRAELDSGERIFVKYGGQADRVDGAALFESEARGLAMLAAARTELVIPEVLAVLREPPALCLTFLEAGAFGPRSEEALGRGLAALHMRAAGAFGREDDGAGARSAYYLAGIRVEAGRSESWAAIFDALLTTLARQAQERGHDDGTLTRALDALRPKLGDRVGRPSPSLLHGDLWSGNALACGDRAGLVDPFAYVGDREVDLAMMGFFGGFSPRTFDAYREVAPARPGERERRPLYELVPLLSHTALFGGSYRGAAVARLRQLV